jgi:hypothetical protein
MTRIHFGKYVYSIVPRLPVPVTEIKHGRELKGKSCFPSKNILRSEKMLQHTPTYLITDTWNHYMSNSKNGEK